MLTPVNYTLPAFWASYLINGDDSGLEHSERREANLFIAEHDLPFPVSCSDESWFSWRNDATLLGGDVMEYTFLIPSQDNHAVIN